MKIFSSLFVRPVKAVLKHAQSRRSAKNPRLTNGAKRLDCGGSPPLFLWRNFAAGFGMLATMILFLAVGATAQTTNILPDAEIQGHALAQKVVEQWPTTTNTLQTGILSIRDPKGNWAKIPITLAISVHGSSWYADFQAKLADGSTEFLNVHHRNDDPNVSKHFNPDHNIILPIEWTPFANSDFWVSDLALDFFHWPQQKVLKKEIHRSCGCTVLESVNPYLAMDNTLTNDYSRVVSWIDDESLGIVEAYAYDMNGKKLKDFYPKDFKKVNGQWQVQTLVMENLQTGSKSQLRFDLKK
jgi:hypothetical protein